ncbi:hypothetical protein BKA61DRAFT_571527 [Leptodontidium sp. MPI-SDFR-AT-0119]|nr:hypothetical protein BKA61DRAFT_571527 [Leptodontidium sp. MPI-SDFR-AT-0119]
MAQRITHTKVSPNVVVVTDLVADLDNLLAIVELDPLHNIGLINIMSYIANLKPAKERARFRRGALDSLGRRDILITWGEVATTKSRLVHPHEFNCDFIAENVVFTPYRQPKSDPGNPLEIESGISLLSRLVKNPMANNNRGFDMDSANIFYEFMCRNKIPSVVFTKVTATASTILTKVLKDMAATGHVLGKHLYKVQVDLDLKYYEASGDKKRRFRSHMDEKWFLETRTNWFLSHTEDEPYPKGLEVLEYVLVVPYDPLAALEVAGPDVRDALNVLKPFKDQSIHKIVGRRAPNPKTNDLGDIGINVVETQTVLEALFTGSLMACQESLSSQTCSGPKDH